MADTIDKTLLGLGQQMVKEMKGLIKLNGSFASGELYNSVKARVFKDKQDVYHLEINYIYYGMFVDKGTRPGHFPNIESIRRWCRLKNISQDAAFFIARNIFRHGTRARPFTTPWTKDSATIQKILQEMGKQFADDAEQKIIRDAKYFPGRIK
jgi:hypothetical protein